MIEIKCTQAQYNRLIECATTRTANAFWEKQSVFPVRILINLR